MSSRQTLRPRRVALVIGMVCAAALPAAGYAQPAVQPFSVTISLSPRAASRLAAFQEGITVSAMFSGDPIAAGRRQADERGQIGLATENVTIPGVPGSAAITGAGVTEAKMRLLRNRDVKLLINVFSARRRVPDNLLDCGLFDDSAALAARQPVHINCKLITEGF